MECARCRSWWVKWGDLGRIFINLMAWSLGLCKGFVDTHHEQGFWCLCHIFQLPSWSLMNFREGFMRLGRRMWALVARSAIWGAYIPASHESTRTDLWNWDHSIVHAEVHRLPATALCINFLLCLLRSPLSLCGSAIFKVQSPPFLLSWLFHYLKGSPSQDVCMSWLKRLQRN